MPSVLRTCWPTSTASRSRDRRPPTRLSACESPSPSYLAAGGGSIQCPRRSRRTGRPRRATGRSQGPECVALPTDKQPDETTEYSSQLQAALSAVSRACGVCKDVQQAWQSKSQDAESIEKSDRTPVTIADYGVQATVALELQVSGHQEPLLAEEDAAELRRQDPSSTIRRSVVDVVAANCSQKELDEDMILRAIDSGSHDGTAAPHWVLDPIDGTVGFLKGGSCQYTVGLGLVQDGVVVVGCMGLPNWDLPIPSMTGEEEDLGGPGVVLFAAKGFGTWVRRLRGGKSYRVRVSTASSLHEGGVLCISDHEDYGTLPMAAALSATGPPSEVLPLCCGSLCKYAAVALGTATAFIQHPVKGFPRLKNWDHAAGIVCVTEAGGRVSDLHGKDLPMGQGKDFVPGGGGVAVTNGLTHNGLLAAAVGAGMWWRGPPLPDISHLCAPGTSDPDALPLLVCIDRDGVINQDVGSPGVTSSEDFELIPGASEAIAALNAAGAHVCVVTNQSAVGKGMLSPEDLVEIHDKLRACLASEGAWVDGILVACDAAAGAGSRRKPGPGMLQEAMNHFGVGPKQAVFIGDTFTDMQAAASANISRRVLVTTGHGKAIGASISAEGVTLPVTILPARGTLAGIPPELTPVTVQCDLLSAVRTILMVKKLMGT